MKAEKASKKKAMKKQRKAFRQLASEAVRDSSLWLGVRCAVCWFVLLRALSRKWKVLLGRASRLGSRPTCVLILLAWFFSFVFLRTQARVSGVEVDPVSVDVVAQKLDSDSLRAFCEELREVGAHLFFFAVAPPCRAHVVVVHARRVDGGSHDIIQTMSFQVVLDKVESIHAAEEAEHTARMEATRAQAKVGGWVGGWW